MLNKLQNIYQVSSFFLKPARELGHKDLPRNKGNRPPPLGRSLQGLNADQKGESKRYSTIGLFRYS